MREREEAFILKPSMANQTRGIVVFDTIAALQTALQEEGAEDVREWVIQRYIAAPLLVGGRKFHLRAYLLCVGALEVFVYRDVLTLSALAPYNAADLGDLRSHLTNTCRQAPQGPQEEAAAVGLLADLAARIAADGAFPLEEAAVRVAAVEADLLAILGEALQAVSAELSFIPLENAFELFGMDLASPVPMHSTRRAGRRPRAGEAPPTLGRLRRRWWTATGACGFWRPTQSRTLRRRARAPPDARMRAVQPV